MGMPKIYIGKMTRKDIYFYRAELLKCFFDFSVFDNIDLRNVLLLYDTVPDPIGKFEMLEATAQLIDKPSGSMEILQVGDCGRSREKIIKPHEKMIKRRRKVIKRRAIIIELHEIMADCSGIMEKQRGIMEKLLKIIMERPEIME